MVFLLTERLEDMLNLNKAKARMKRLVQHNKPYPLN
jgi:hypothetical protein